MSKTRRVRRSFENAEARARRLVRGKIPLVHMFTGNPTGAMISLLLLFVTVLYWISGAPTDPFNTYPDFVSQWTLFYNNTKWFLTIALPCFFLAVALDAVWGRRSSGPQAIGGGGLAARLRSVQLRKFGREQQPSRGEVNIFVNQQLAGRNQLSLPSSRIEKAINVTPKEQAK